MQKLFVAIAAAGVFAFAGGALADPNPNSEITGNQGTGNQGCGVTGTETKNPGTLFRYIRDTYDQNPSQFIEDRDFGYEPPEIETVGQYIEANCHRPDNTPD